MSKVELTVACEVTDRTRALYEGTVRPTGIELQYLPLSNVAEVFWRMSRHQEFDVSEMSMAAYMISKDRGKPDLVAIPVFPLRVFRHSFLFVNEEANIDDPHELKGKKVGVPEYGMTAALWIRGILQHEYDVSPEEVRWFRGRPEERLEIEIPEGVRIEGTAEDTTLRELLQAGELDAVLAPGRPESFASSKSIRRLFPNYRETEQDYYRKTGFFPIMHTVVIRREVYTENPWIGQELTKAFTEAKERALRSIRSDGHRSYAAPWLSDLVSEVRSVMGDDYWEYGVENNRDILEAMVGYAHEQGLTQRKLDVDELFAEPTYDTYKG